jgi:DNA repair protein RecN (Recombination protein N)
MLLQIHIKDLAIVSSLEVDFVSGMTAMTGETGAGKSILIDALGLVLGDRADNGMIRADGDRAEITAVFSIQGQTGVADWLRRQELDQGDECILRRVLVRNGNSRAFINGTPAPIKSLQELGDQLVNIHGQHAHHALLRREHQLSLLDDYAAHSKLLTRVGKAHQQWQQTQQSLDRLRGAARERAERIDLLRYQINELTELQLGEHELDALDEEHRRLSSADQLLECCSQALGHLDEENAALSLLNRSGNELLKLVELDPGVKESQELVEGAAIQIQEAISSLRQYADGVELDPQRLSQLDRRLAECHDMARKYRCGTQELIPHLARLQQELEQLEQSDIQLAQLEQSAGDLKAAYLQQAEKLDLSRIKAAKRLSREVTAGMQALSMANGQFAVTLERLPEEKAAASGLNRLEFMVTTNPGQPAKPLAKVASGGELSRISLAIQVATANCSQIPTLIFDEVDVGIGGGTAEIVGRLLRQIGQAQQVLCVTHLPQVAAQAHQHLLVSKQSRGDKTHTRLSDIAGEARINEVARMLGGLEMTQQTLAHAREMLVTSS